MCCDGSHGAGKGQLEFANELYRWGPFKKAEEVKIQVYSKPHLEWCLNVPNQGNS